MNWEPYLRDVRPKILRKRIWLKRDTKKDVIFDLLKGDISCPLWYVRSHTLMFVQTFVFSLFWIGLGALTVSVAGLLLFEKPSSDGTSLWGPLGRADLGGYLAASSAIYWNIAKRYGDQWTYCAGVFNKIFYDKFPSDKPLEHLYRKATFAIDLIDCNLWHHRSFVTDFNYILECAIRHRFRADSTSNDEIAKFQRSEKTVSDARSAIAEFQNDLEEHLQHRSLLNGVVQPQQSPTQGAGSDAASKSESDGGKLGA